MGEHRTHASPHSRDAEITRLTQGGAATREIAGALTMCQSAVRNAQLRLGIVARCEVRAWTPAEDAQLDELIAAGKTHRQIARVMGRSHQSIEKRSTLHLSLRGRPVTALHDDVPLKPFAELAPAHQKTLRRLLPEWFGGEARP